MWYGFPLPTLPYLRGCEREESSSRWWRTQGLTYNTWGFLTLPQLSEAVQHRIPCSSSSLLSPAQTSCLLLQQRGADLRPRRRRALFRSAGRRWSSGDYSDILSYSHSLSQHGGHHHGHWGKSDPLRLGSLSHSWGAGEL